MPFFRGNCSAQSEEDRHSASLNDRSGNAASVIARLTARCVEYI